MSGLLNRSAVRGFLTYLTHKSLDYQLTILKNKVEKDKEKKLEQGLSDQKELLVEAEEGVLSLETPTSKPRRKQAFKLPVEVKLEVLNDELLVTTKMFEAVKTGGFVELFLEILPVVLEQHDIGDVTKAAVEFGSNYLDLMTESREPDYKLLAKNFSKLFKDGSDMIIKGEIIPQSFLDFSVGLPNLYAE